MATSSKPNKSDSTAKANPARPSSSTIKPASGATRASGAATNPPRRVAAARRQSVPLYFYGLILLLLIVVGGGLYSIFTGSNQKLAGDAPLTAQQVADKGILYANVNAKVTVVEFGDFQCPACSEFHVTPDFGPQFKAQFLDTNKVRFVWLDYPLVQAHPKAMKAAEAGRCANEQGKFWPFHDKLYDNQDQWVKGDENTLWKSYATEVGIDSDKLMQCVQAEQYKGAIQASIDAANQVGVGGTPTFLVNHVLNKPRTVPSAADLAQLINQESLR